MKPQLLEYSLSDQVRAFSTTRIGGYGTGAYSAFNITHYCGDSAENVKKNRELLCGELGINDGQLILPRQIHSNEVLCLDDSFLKHSDEEKSKCLEGIDAVITDIPRICIGVSTADCVPVLLFDGVKKVAAAVHAGWRGTVGKIVLNTISKMTSRYGCDVADIKAVIGPSISLGAFEVGAEVYDEFEKAGFTMREISKFYPTADGDVTLDGRIGKWHIDLWAANYLLLDSCGIRMENIQVANVCTYSSSEEFFSARKLGIQSGRIFSGILIK